MYGKLTLGLFRCCIMLFILGVLITLSLLVYVMLVLCIAHTKHVCLFVCFVCLFVCLFYWNVTCSGHIYLSLFRCTFKIFTTTPVTQHQVLLSLDLSTTVWHSIRTKGCISRPCWLAIFSNWQSEMRVSSQRTISNIKAVTRLPKTKMGECQHDFFNSVLVNEETILKS